MLDYKAPIEDMLLAMNEIGNLPSIGSSQGDTEGEAYSAEIVHAILDAAASFSQEVLSPLNRIGEQHGVKLTNGAVITAPGYADAYQKFVDNGWPSLPVDIEDGGQGLPELMNAAVMETVMSSNLAFSFCPMLTQGALKVVKDNGSDKVKRLFLSKMVSGEWTAAMDLTEPGAGSDLSATKTKAVRDGDKYRIQGQKIFISWGDHDIANNILHLVLARLPDAPEGTRGISLFLVPKYLVNDDGSIIAQNDVETIAIEEKLGQHASPTCVMSYGEKGGAVGYLLGEENKGLACMFTMMNHARINVGLQGLGLAEQSYQKATLFASDRVQGGLPIEQYPDVKRMLLMMKTGCASVRSMVYLAMSLIDRSSSVSEPEPEAANRRLQLLTPIVKAWCTDLTQEITSLAIQIHGGMGYIEETGVAQYYRDARILPIYEGTNGIQAIDLVSRKFLKDGGSELNALLFEIRADLQLASEISSLKSYAKSMALILNSTITCKEIIIDARDSGKCVLPIAGYFLDVLGYCIATWLMGKRVVSAFSKIDIYGSKTANEQLENLEFFMRNYATRIYGLEVAIRDNLQN